MSLLTSKINVLSHNESDIAYLHPSCYLLPSCGCSKLLSGSCVNDQHLLPHFCHFNGFDCVPLTKAWANHCTAHMLHNTQAF